MSNNFEESTLGKRVIFVIGGVRSGKSRFALRLGESIGTRRILIATAQALDSEMKQRIEQHRTRRSKTWLTYEEPVEIKNVLEKLNDEADVILIDCLSLWVSNLMHMDLNDEEVGVRFSEFIKTLEGLTPSVVLVSNEVGLGVIPANPTARRYCDFLGVLHQEVARQAQEVHLLTAGIATKLK